MSGSSPMPAEQRSNPLIVGISGASGAIYGVRMLAVLKELGIETHLIMTHSAHITLAAETDLKVVDVEKLASAVYDNQEIGAACSSGSFLTRGMIVAPCSVKSLSEIAFCPGDNLLSRAADVTLKERRPARFAAAGDTASSWAYPEHARSHRSRCDRLPARSRVLCAPQKPRGHGQPHRWARARSFRDRRQACFPLDRHWLPKPVLSAASLSSRQSGRRIPMVHLQSRIACPQCGGLVETFGAA